MQTAVAQELLLKYTQVVVVVVVVVVIVVLP